MGIEVFGEKTICY